MKPTTNIMNILDESVAVDVLTGKLPIKVIYRDKLAERLGITPKERLSLTLVVTDTILAVSALVDGGDLTPGQERIFIEFLRETGAFTAVIGTFPERPVAS